jgi:hypothetical protein
MILKLCVLVAGLSVLANGVRAVTYIDTFESSNEGWDAEDYPGRNDLPEAQDAPMPTATLGGQDALRIIGTDNPEGTDLIFTDGSGALLTQVGDTDLSTVDFGNGDEMAMYVTFDFWANANISGGGDFAPSALEFYFYSGDTYWRYNIIDQVLLDGWNSITVAWWGWNGSGWLTEGAGDTFTDTLNGGGTLEMGLMLTYQGFTTEEYGIGTFEIHNPEPGTYAVLAFALMSLGVTCRQKLRTGIHGLLRK